MTRYTSVTGSSEIATSTHWSQEDLSAIIDELELANLQKRFLISRWLAQVAWAEAQANNARKWYYRLRLIVITGSIVVATLASLTNPALLGTVTNEVASQVVGWTTLVLGLIVSISAALEQFYNFRGHWENYERQANSLGNEGWRYFQLSGPYRRYKNHYEAFRAFGARSDDLIEGRGGDSFALFEKPIRKEEEEEEAAGWIVPVNKERSE